MTDLVQLESRPTRRSRSSHIAHPAAFDLASDLAARVRGEVRFDEGSRALYATDASNYRQVPIGVVVPLDRADVEATVEICRRHDVPVLGRGAGTSLAGQCCNAAVVIDFSKHMNRVLSIDPDRGTARVEPGVILDRLREAAAEHGLTFGPDPATHRWCTIGGMIGNNSCGVHSVTTGRTSDNVERLTMLLYDGTVLDVGATGDDELEERIARGGRDGAIHARLRDLRDRYAPSIRDRYPSIPRRVSGYNLDELLPENGFHVARALVGTEGTCGIVLEAEVKLTPAPVARALLVLGYENVYVGADHVPDILEQQPIGLEGIDEKLVMYMRRKGLHVDHLRLLPEGRGWMLVEFGGEDEAAARKAAEDARNALCDSDRGPSARVITDPEEAEVVWTIRESGLGATAFVPGMESTWEGWEDAAVEPARLGEYLREFQTLLEEYGYEGALYGHFGDGCVHTRINFDLVTAEGIRTFRRFIDEAADLVLRYNGSLSGEHGDGQSRAALLPKMFGEELIGAFREFRSIWDPDGRMNPGKIVDPNEPDEDLRFGTGYRPDRVETHFQFPEDGGDFARATMRCVGVGKCRRTDAGTMCPSYQVTHEEKHATRGRAHLLFEMMRDDSLADGWRSEEVKEALDLCLACKGCKGECPVQVDVATYKAEFLSHYYEGRLRPPAAYSMGLISWWARLAALAPGVVNALAHAPVLSDLIKRAGGIAPEREMPRFAERTFRQRHGSRREGSSTGETRGRVLLWTDTFTNHFDPEVALAAVEVLEAFGFEVVLPRSGLCCGRPLYDWGMLDLAKRQLTRILEALEPELRKGTPIIVLEPSCASVFRDELPNLMSGDPEARRLASQVLTLGEFLSRERVQAALELPELDRDVLLHGHCHETSVLDFSGERSVLRAVARAVHEPDTGCCGMAGSFGFERANYEVSQACGERVLLPQVQAAGPDTLIVTDGFSCRQQIMQNTDRQPLHLAEVLHLALERAGRVPSLSGHEAQQEGSAQTFWSPRRAGWLAAGAAAGLFLAHRFR